MIQLLGFWGDLFIDLTLVLLHHLLTPLLMRTSTARLTELGVGSSPVSVDMNVSCRVKKESILLQLWLYHRKIWKKQNRDSLSSVFKSLKRSFYLFKSSGALASWKGSYLWETVPQRKCWRAPQGKCRPQSLGWSFGSVRDECGPSAGTGSRLQMHLQIDRIAAFSLHCSVQRMHYLLLRGKNTHRKHLAVADIDSCGYNSSQVSSFQW